MHLHPFHPRDFDRQRDGAVHDRTHRGEVVQRHQRIHLKLRPRKQLLHHHQPHSLKHNATTLKQESNQHKLNLPKTRYHHTNDNERNIPQRLPTRGTDPHGPGGEEGDDGHGGLEHLDEGDGEVEVGEVAADQGEGEHQAYGQDAAEVDAAGHGHAFAAVEGGGEARQELGH